MIRKQKFIWIILLFNLIFYFPVFSGKTPLPADNLLAYYPWRFYREGYQAKGPAYFDVTNITYPWKKLAVLELKNGNLPLWNKYFSLGYPYFAAMQGGILYPTTVLFLVLPFNFAWSIHIFLQTFLAGIFMYLLLRHFKLSEISSLFGALTFSFSGHFMVWLEYGTLVNAACWLPLVILLIEELFTPLRPSTSLGTSEGRRKILVSLLIGIVMAFSFFAGFPQTSFYVLGFSVIYFFYKLRGVKKKEELGFLGTLGLLVFTGLIAIQLLPFLEYLSLSTRNLIDPAKYFSWAMLPTNLIGFVFPNLFGHPSRNTFWGRGNYQEFTIYFGVIPFIIAVWALLRRKVPKFWLYSLLAVAILLIYNPLLYQFYKFNLPILSKMAPSRLIILITFILTIVSSYGFEQFIKEKRLPVLDFFLIYGGISIILIFDIIFLKQQAIQQRFLYNFEKVFPEILSSLFLPGLILWSFLVLLILTDLGRIKRKTLVVIIFLLTFIDLFIFGREYNPFIEIEKLIPSTKAENFLKSNAEQFRFYSEGNVFPGNYASLFGLNALNSQDTLSPVNFSKFTDELEQKKQLVLKQKLFDLANVKYYLTKDVLNMTGYKLVFKGEGINIYDRGTVYPRYYFIAEGKGKPENVAIEVGEEKSDKIVLRANFPQKGKLVISDLYFPGWEAQVNGAKTKISPYLEVFEAIDVGKGENLVEISYQPSSFKIGTLVTLITLALITSSFGFLGVKYLQGK